jgi:protein O-mannosyl-transferase
MILSRKYTRFSIKKPLIWAVIILLCVFIYYPLRSAGFLNFDDNWSIFNNPYVQSVNFLNSFRFAYYTDYTPATTFYFSLVNKAFGMNPFYFHFFNLLLHLLNGILIFRLGRTVFKFNLLTAYFFAAIFLIHPMHVESVAWITETKDVLSVFFVLLSWLAFHRFKSFETYRTVFYAASLMFFFLSLGSKTISVTFPLLLLLFYFVYHRGNFSKQVTFQILPFFGLSFLFSLLRIYAESGEMLLVDAKLGPILLIKNTVIKYVFYFSRSIFPHHLSGFYENGIFQLFWYEYLIVLAFFIAIYLIHRKTQDTAEQQHIVYLPIFTVIALLPMLKIVPWSVNFMVADRYMYFPSIGLYALFAILLTKLVSLKQIRIVVVIYMIFLTLHLSVSARNRVYVWHNDYNLWTDVLKKYPNTKKGLHNLSVQHMIRKEYPKALALQTKLLELEPRNVKNRLNMITPKFKPGEMDKAIQDIEALEKETQENMTIAQMLAIFYYQQKEYQKAIEKMKVVLKFDPTHLMTHKLLININQHLKDRDLYLFQKSLIDEFKIPIDLPKIL